MDEREQQVVSPPAVRSSSVVCVSVCISQFAFVFICVSLCWIVSVHDTAYLLRLQTIRLLLPAPRTAELRATVCFVMSHEPPPLHPRQSQRRGGYSIGSPRLIGICGGGSERLKRT